MMDLYRPDECAVAVLTVDRNPQYVHQTLASMLAADPAVHSAGAIWLMVGSDDASYLRQYLHHEKLRIVPLSADEASEVKGWSVHRRFNHNYQRCRTAPLANARGVLVCEDDVVFRDSFFTRLLATIREMEVDHGLTDYALALFAAYDFECESSFHRGKLFCRYGYPYYGTPCMYYPAAAAREIAAFIHTHGVEACEEPGDLLIKRLYGDRMYACPRALAQHVGEVSTGLGGGGGTVTFGRPYRPICANDWGKKT